MSLKETMETFQNDPSAKHEKALLAELERAEFLAPVIMAAPLAKPDGSAYYEEEGSNIKFALLEDEEAGGRYFPAFTSREEMMKWRADSEQEVLSLRLKDYAAMLADEKNDYAGVVIDAYSQALTLNLAFFRSLFG